MAPTVEPTHNEAGLSTVGTLGWMTVAGTVLFVGLGHSGLDMPYYSKLEPRPQVIQSFYKTERLCVGGYTAAGAEVATITSMGLKKGFIDVQIPGSDVKAQVSGTTDTKVCQEAQKVDAVFDPIKRMVTVTLAPDSITYESAVHPLTARTKYSEGFSADLRDAVGSIIKVAGLNFIDSQADTAQDLAREVAILSLIDSARTTCADTAYKDFIKNRLVEVNRKAILRSAKTFGIDVNTVVVNPPATTPNAAPAFHDKIEEMRAGKNNYVKVERLDKSSVCTVSPNVTVKEQ